MYSERYDLLNLYFRYGYSFEILFKKHNNLFFVWFSNEINNFSYFCHTTLSIAELSSQLESFVPINKLYF